MKRFILIVTTLMAVMGISSSLAAPSGHHHHYTPAPAWTELPLLTQRRQGRGTVVFTATNLPDGAVTVYSPAHPNKSEQVVEKKYAAKGGNYHLAVSGQGSPRVASTAFYFSRPGPPPRALLKASRPGLELTPMILPREHSSYRAGESWPFQVRRDGEPVAGAEVVLETELGDKQSTVSDDKGALTITLPKRFKEPQDHGHGLRSRTAFVVAATVNEEVAAFNATYRPDGYYGKSLWMGVGFGLLGMGLATPLVRRRKGGAA